MMNQSEKAHRSQTSQHGYILVPTLLFLAVSTVLVVALAGAVKSNLMVSKISIGGPSATGPSGTPAGEVDLADTSIRAVLYKLTKPGENGVCDVSGSNPFGGDKVITSGGIKMMVGCEFTGYTAGPAPNARIFLDEGQETIRLVGNNYNSYKGISRKDWQGAVSPYGNPWLDALTINTYNAYAGALGPNGQLVHVGKMPLIAVGGVSAKKVIAPLNTDTRNNPDPRDSSAMQVSGKVTQGEGNPDNLAGPSNFPLGDPSKCGFTEVNDSASPTATRADVIAKPLSSASPALIQCGNAVAAARTSDNSGLDGPTWDNATIQRNRQQILDKAGVPTTDCSGFAGRKDLATDNTTPKVIELAGAYGPAETKILNEWFRSCKATYHFVGDTYFDVYDPTVSDARKNSLVFDLSESNYVVGAYADFNTDKNMPMSAFPNACDRTTPPLVNGEVQTRGASITLSSRTGLRHNNGRVAICGPKQTGNTYHKTAIRQVKATDLTNWSPTLENVTLNSAVCGTCVPFANFGADEYRATVTGPSGFSRINAQTVDAGLVDGHLPVDLTTLKAKLTVSYVTSNLLIDNAVPSNGSNFVVKLRMPRPQYRQVSSQRQVDYLECKSTAKPLTLGVKEVSLADLGGSCAYRDVNGGSQGTPAQISIGELVRYVGRCNGGQPKDDQTQSTCDATFSIDVGILRVGTSSAPMTVGISSVTTANKPALIASTTPGFTLPLAPLSVRWAPRPLNGDGTNRPGDALFNVFGSVSLPYNAVEVRWGPKGRATGTPIFNGGIVPAQNCNETNTSGCRPAIVAGAFASWSTQGDPKEGVCETCKTPPFTGTEAADISDLWWPTWQEDAGKLVVPDVLARNADGREPRRNYRMTACVILDDRGTPSTLDDKMAPRSFVDTYTVDTQTGLEISGSAPVVVRSGVINILNFSEDGKCTRPANYQF
ncbi:unannotated protein [freshwater metagenome]|uniref:Unannotated protein n=1 Tax=freshwater metagenome TaxID=449393 RepID=A0A6J7S0F2_9ZZZZ|nr:hypothetical protein [Actinomycetota bacterium]